MTKTMTNTDKIRAFLQTHPGSTGRQIWMGLDVPMRPVYTALAGMIKRHELVRVKVPDVGRDARVTAYSLGSIT